MNRSVFPSLGILDWGIGGLGFYSLLKAKHPNIPVVYLSDSGETPYGKLPALSLRLRVEKIIQKLSFYGATHLVVACNAASTALPKIQSRQAALKTNSLQITGVIEHGIRGACDSRPRLVGIVGGRRTILSGIYRRGLNSNGRIVRQRIAQPLSAHIEAGNIDTEDLYEDLKKIMNPINNVDVLVLACTHYVAIKKQFQETAPEAIIIDPAEETLKWVESHWELPKGSGEDIFLTTGDPYSMKEAACKAFGVIIGQPEKISI